MKEVKENFNEDTKSSTGVDEVFLSDSLSLIQLKEGRVDV